MQNLIRCGCCCCCLVGSRGLRHLCSATGPDALRSVTPGMQRTDGDSCRLMRTAVSATAANSVTIHQSLTDHSYTQPSVKTHLARNNNNVSMRTKQQQRFNENEIKLLFCLFFVVDVFSCFFIAVSLWWPLTIHLYFSKTDLSLLSTQTHLYRFFAFVRFCWLFPKTNTIWSISYKTL